MTKREIGFLVVGAVVGLGLAYGVLHFPSAEVAEVAEVEERLEKLEERTVAEVAEQLAETEEQIAAVEADIEYLKIEITAVLRQMYVSGSRGGSNMAEVPAVYWDEMESCWRGERCDHVPARFFDPVVFVSYCGNQKPQCRAAMETLIVKRDELGKLELTKFDLEVQLAKLELDQNLRERERE